MQWTDSGIVLGTRRHGESSVVLELMTALHGRHYGLVRGGAGRRYTPMLQPGNSVLVTWSARIEEQLGTYTVEAQTMRAAQIIGSAPALYCVGYLASLLRLLPERDPHDGLHDGLELIMSQLERMEVAAPLVVRFEIAILTALGFGLDLKECAATGSRHELVYVSPRTGRAVSREAGLPYHDKLLSLPAFATGGAGHNLSPDSLREGFALTQFFLERHVFEPRGLMLTDQRASFIDAVMRGMGEQDSPPRQREGE
jgi:DNA repair protein RecO (recombination protein O)